MRGNNNARYIGRFESAWPITATEGGKRGSFCTESMRVFAFNTFITVNCYFQLHIPSLKTGFTAVRQTPLTSTLEQWMQLRDEAFPTVPIVITELPLLVLCSYVTGWRTAQLSGPQFVLFAVCFPVFADGKLGYEMSMLSVCPYPSNSEPTETYLN